MKELSPAVRQAILYAQQEAARLGENYVGTEHLLLGLIRADNRAVGILQSLKINLVRVRQEVMRQVSRGDDRIGQTMQLTPRAKRVMDFACEKALNLNASHVGTEHLLSGLLREEEGIASRVLRRLGVEPEQVEQAVDALASLHEGQPADEPAAEAAEMPGRQPDEPEVVFRALHVLWKIRETLLAEGTNSMLTNHRLWPLLETWVRRASAQSLDELWHQEPGLPEMAAMEDELRQLASREGRGLAIWFLISHPEAIAALLMEEEHPGQSWPYCEAVFARVFDRSFCFDIPNDRRDELITTFMRNGVRTATMVCALLTERSDRIVALQHEARQAQKKYMALLSAVLEMFTSQANVLSLLKE